MNGPAGRTIRVSTAVSVLGVAGIAACVSCWHAYEVVCAHGGSGVTAQQGEAVVYLSELSGIIDGAVTPW